VTLAAGARLGSYEIQAAIGAGGMGEVYRATDTVLKRQVALKVLPTEVANDPERVARFQREAEVLASLNHPNIAHLYGLERSGGTLALVMELVEGPTLADRIGQGAIPADEALPIARQIAEALEAPHEQGIIHRDLKPANIKVRDDGTVKVLDFGLAKAMEPLASASTPTALTNSPTITSPALMTGVGMLLGTAAYMSPEQAKGRPADKRSDIWAFGCVLYEMLTGYRPFDGDGTSEILAAVIKSGPDWKALPPSLPASLRTLLRRTLEKDRFRRIADMADARLELDDASRPGAQSNESVDGQPRRRIGMAFIGFGALAVIAAVLSGVIVRQSSDRATHTLRFTIMPPEGWKVGFDFLNGSGAINLPIAVSPDGRYVAMVGVDNEKRGRLWIRSLDALAARELAGTDGATAPFWSPDSRFIAFYADGKLKKIDLAGGPAIPLCSVATFNSGTWGSQGVIVFSKTGGSGESGLLKVSQVGGAATAATTLGDGEILHIRPAFLPDGVHFLYRATSQTGKGGIFIGSLNSNDRQRLFPDGIGNVLYSRGHVLFLQETTLMAQAFDARRLALTGEATPIADHIQTNGLGAPVGSFSASESGVLAYQAGAAEELGTQLTWRDRSGTPLGVIGVRRVYTDLELSPDGKYASVAVPRLTGGGRDVWLVDLGRGGMTRFTFQDGSAQTSVWSPDGSRLAFNAMNRGKMDLFQKPVNGGAEVLLLSDTDSKAPWSWSPDNRYIVYSNVLGSASSTNLWLFPVSGDGKPIRLFSGGFTQLYGRVSPDGHWIAFSSDDSGQQQVYIASFPDANVRKYQVSTSMGTEPRWRGDGKEIYFLNGETLFAASVEVEGSGLQVGVAKPLFQFRSPGIPRSSYAVRPDGQQFLFNERVEPTGSAPITIVVNWDKKDQ
jgi:Tol biopolymer transport system component